MDVNDMRVVVTVAGFVLFIALAVHTWSRRRRPDHEAAARLPFADDDAVGRAQLNNEQGERRE
jgi:cbb3-type cytochrome oxidase subunit 3